MGEEKRKRTEGKINERECTISAKRREMTRKRRADGISEGRK